MIVEISIGFVVAVFGAGLLMFLAPCTLPLVPAYLAFISGVKNEDLQNEETAGTAKRAIIKNGLAFIAGFSLIFILFGVAAGFAGGLIAEYRILLTQIGGAFIIFFGLMMLGAFKISFLQTEHKIRLPHWLQPGSPWSALLIGIIFALGWTPCVGPVLAAVLLLASTSSTALTGGLLLAVFSFGLAVPFLITTFLYTKASHVIAKSAVVTKWVSIIGGVFLLLLGFLLITNNFGLTVIYGLQFFDFLGLSGIMNHL